MKLGLRWVIAVLLVSCFSYEANAQELFANTYGGNGNDWAYAIQQTREGGYVLAGPASSFGAGGYDFWVVKLDASGNVTWQKTYGGSADDIPNAIQQTTDDGYIVAGRTLSYGKGGFDVWVIKLSASGNIVWQKTIGGSGSDLAYSVRQTKDGGYVVAGGTDSSGAGNLDFWVIKLDSSGDSIWQYTYGGSSVDLAYASEPTADGGLVVAGGAVSFGAGGYDVWVLKLSASGTVMWQKAFGGPSDDLAFAIEQTADGGFIVAGRTNSYGAGNTDFWILKLKASGELEWQRTYGGSAVDWAFSVRQTSDGGYVAAGRTDSFGAGSSDVWILKLDASGNILWQRTFGGSSLDYAYSINLAQDGSYLVAGVAASFGAGSYDMVALKLEPSCILGAACSYLSATSVLPYTPSPSVLTTSVTPRSTSYAPASTAASAVSSAASKGVPCVYASLPGAVSDTLTVSKSGTSPRLSWQAPGGSCAGTAYGIYRGTFPVFPYNHESLDCTVTGLTYLDFTSGNNQYYLVVPHNASLEGSYGKSREGPVLTERPAGSSACRPRCPMACP
jgi:hypothetical protein